jgi:hypothetical protein
VSVRVYTLEVFDNATGVLRAVGLQALRSIAPVRTSQSPVALTFGLRILYAYEKN